MTGAGHDPHASSPIVRHGAPLEGARAVAAVVHGRGARAADILAFADTLGRPDFAFLAPEAAGGTWYPLSFLAPIEANEPFLSSALAKLRSVIELIERHGVPRSRVLLLGFSQGACLTLEFAARTGGRWGGIVGLSGGLIGPEGTPRDYPSAFGGTPIFLGCSTADAHVPANRVAESAAVFRRLGAEVDVRLYPGMGHLVNEDEMAVVGAMMDRLLPRGGAPDR